jgi:hypothetical protein
MRLILEILGMGLLLSLGAALAGAVAGPKVAGIASMIATVVWIFWSIQRARR